MAEKTILDSLANALAVATVMTRKQKKPTVRRTRTARQVLDKNGNIITLYNESETVTYTRN